MPKYNRSGQAAVLSEADSAKIRRQLKNKGHRLFWDLACYTGERWGAIAQLQVLDVYEPYSLKPREVITFRAVTRKADPSGQRQTRQVDVHPTLREILEAYTPASEGYLFPSSQRPGQPISFAAASLFLRAALESAGLGRRGFSTHSTRRTFITRLYYLGVDLKTLQAITGHKALSALEKYVEVKPERVRAAIALL